MSIEGEIKEIGKLINSAAFLMAVRKEVTKAMREGFVVTGGREYSADSKHDVVVKCGSGEDKVTRRIRETLKDVRIESIAFGIIGVSRRRNDG